MFAKSQPQVAMTDLAKAVDVEDMNLAQLGGEGNGNENFGAILNFFKDLTSNIQNPEAGNTELNKKIALRKQKELAWAKRANANRARVRSNVSPAERLSRQSPNLNILASQRRGARAADFERASRQAPVSGNGNRVGGRGAKVMPKSEDIRLAFKYNMPFSKQAARKTTVNVPTNLSKFANLKDSDIESFEFKKDMFAKDDSADQDLDQAVNDEKAGEEAEGHDEENDTEDGVVEEEFTPRERRKNSGRKFFDNRGGVTSRPMDAKHVNINFFIQGDHTEHDHEHEDDDFDVFGEEGEGEDFEGFDEGDVNDVDGPDEQIPRGGDDDETTGPPNPQGDENPDVFDDDDTDVFGDDEGTGILGNGNVEVPEPFKKTLVQKPTVATKEQAKSKHVNVNFFIQGDVNEHHHDDEGDIFDDEEFDVDGEDEEFDVDGDADEDFGPDAVDVDDEPGVTVPEAKKALFVPFPNGPVKPAGEPSNVIGAKQAQSTEAMEQQLNDVLKNLKEMKLAKSQEGVEKKQAALNEDLLERDASDTLIRRMARREL